MLGWCAETTLVAAGLAALAVLLGRSRRLTAEARHALWLVVLLRFLVPPLVAWPWARGDRPGMSEAAPTTAASVDLAPVPPPTAPLLVASRRPRVGPPPPGRDAGAVGGSADPAAEPRAAEPEDDLAVASDRPAPVAAGKRPDWRSALLAGWLVGSVAVAIRGVVRLARFGRGLRLAEGAPGWLAAEVAGVAGRLGVRRVPASVVAAGLPAPLLWCLGRPRLVLPAGLGRVTIEARAVLIAHELAHLARRDHWVARLELLAGPIWWWNPVFRLARRRLRDAAEAACDARVVRAFPEHRFAYAEALVEACTPRARPGPPLPALGIGGPRAARTLEARLTMILRDPARPPSRRLAPLAIGLLALAAPAWTRGQQPPEPSPASFQDPALQQGDPGVEPREAAGRVRDEHRPGERATRALIQGLEKGLKDRLDQLLAAPGRAAPVDRSEDGPQAIEGRDPTLPAEAAGNRPPADPAQALRDLIHRMAELDPRIVELRLEATKWKAKADEIREVTRDSGDPAEVGARRKLARISQDLRDAREEAEAAIARQMQAAAVRAAADDRSDSALLKAERRLRMAAAVVDRNTALNAQARGSVPQDEVTCADTAYVAALAEADAERAKLAAAPTEPEQAGATPPFDRIVLQARRAAQAAAVRKAEAQLKLAEAVVARNAALNLKIPDSVSKEEVAKVETESQAVQADVDLAKARLAEVEAIIAQARPDPTSAAERPANLADHRDQVDLAAIQVETKRTELANAETRANQAGTSLQAHETLRQAARISPQEWRKAKDADENAQGEVAIKRVEVREAELRLKQARRRADAEEVRIKRLAERARAELHRMRDFLARKLVSQSLVDEARGRYDDLMFQLDPDYLPATGLFEQPAPLAPPAVPPAPR